MLPLLLQPRQHQIARLPHVARAQRQHQVASSAARQQRFHAALDGTRVFHAAMAELPDALRQRFRVHAFDGLLGSGVDVQDEDPVSA